jgi:hypothetical protein
MVRKRNSLIAFLLLTTVSFSSVKAQTKNNNFKNQRTMTVEQVKQHPIGIGKV